MNKNKKETKLGIIGFVLSVLGIISIIFSLIFGFIFSVLAIVFSSKQKKIKKTDFSIAGFTIGIIGTSINSILLLVIIYLLIY